MYFPKQPEPLRPLSKEYDYSHESADLLKALYNIFSRGVHLGDSELLDNAIPHRIVFSIKDKSRQILELLHTGDINLKELYGMCRTRSELVAAFMSVLELCSMGRVSFERKDNDYSLHFNGGDMDEIMEKISD